MTKTQLFDLRRRAQAHLTSWRESGKKVTTYTCRHCRNAIETRQPAAGDVGPKGYWDSMQTCTHCDKLNFVFVWPTGHTEVNAA